MKKIKMSPRWTNCSVVVLLRSSLYVIDNYNPFNECDYSPLKYVTMTQKEQKFVCDLVSLVADAVATGTIPEAEDYLVEKYNGIHNPVLEHTFNVLTEIGKKQNGAI